jgi:hypothetical protein
MHSLKIILKIRSLMYEMWQWIHYTNFMFDIVHWLMLTLYTRGFGSWICILFRCLVIVFSLIFIQRPGNVIITNDVKTAEVSTPEASLGNIPQADLFITINKNMSVKWKLHEDENKAKFREVLYLKYTLSMI